jgi:uncharacterized membrane protein YozB (DUF420 family)
VSLRAGSPREPFTSITMSATISSHRAEWSIPTMLILLSLVPAVFGTLRVAELAGDPEVTAANARFVAQPLPLVLHILAVVPYSILGALQFAPAFRRRNRGWHRAAGRLLAPLGLLAALTGLWMAHFYPWPAGDGQILYVERLVVGTAMAMSIVLALQAIGRRDFVAHGEWMTRAYAIGLGAGTQVLTHLPWALFADGKPGELPRAVMMGAGWAINAVVAEWVIRRRRARASTVSATIQQSRAPAPAPTGT